MVLFQFDLMKDVYFAENQEGLSQAEDCTNDTELAVLLTFHLFTRLSASPRFIVDDQKPAQPKACPCRRRHGQVTYGDTSIGKWHCLEILFYNIDKNISTGFIKFHKSFDRDNSTLMNAEN